MTKEEQKALLKSVGTSIKNLRIKANLTQENMVECGVSLRHYQKIEAGRMNPTLITMAKIYRMLGCSVERLVIK